MRDEGLSADLLVVATSRKVSATKQRSIEDLANEYGVTTVHFYSRAWFVNCLFRNPTWRKRLLPKVGGELPALAARPSSLLSQVVADSELVGRVGVLQHLHELLDDRRDIVLIGPPGVGKTRLCAELGDEVMFVESADESRLLDDLREFEPRLVAVDDADTELETLTLLQRARHDEGHRFAVVAITWPDKAERVRDRLPSPALVEVPLLERAEVDTIITAHGVRGYRARHLVLDQAQGRPGWALALSAALLHGEAATVLSGAALVRQVRSFIERSAGMSSKALDALACLSALGYVSDSEVPRLAGLVGYSPAELNRSLHQSATNGLIDRVRDGWTMAPALDAPLVASWFFSDVPEGSWPALLQAFPDRAADLQKALLAAARTGAAAAQRAADEWAQALPGPVEWDAGTWGLVHAYAALSRARSAWATSAARSVLASERPTETALGITIDLTGDAARRQLKYSLQSYLLPEAITGLLELAIGDDRPRHSNPDHPLRIIADTAQRYDPDHGTALQARKAILKSTLGWLVQVPTDQRWIVASEAVAAILSPEVSGNWPKPDDPMTLSIIRGVDSAKHLTELASQWSTDVSPVLAGTTVGAIPNAAVAYLLGLAEQWLRVGADRTVENVNQDQAVAAAEGGSVILESIRPHVSVVPGLALRAQRLLEETGRSDLAAFEQDPQLLRLAGTRDVGDFEDVKEWLADRQAKIKQLADELLERGPDGVVRRYMELLEQIELTPHFNDLPTALPEAFIDAAQDPVEWAEAALKHGALTILRSAILRMVTGPNAQRLPADLMQAAVADPRVRATAISHALFSSQLTPAVKIAVDRMASSDSWMLDQAMHFHDQADAVVWRLLTHPVQVIRSTTVVSFAVGTSHGPPLPPDWVDHWQAALLETRAEDLGQHAEWRLKQLIEHLVDADPDLAEAWYSRRFGEMDRYVTSLKPYDVEEHLSRLPRPNRQRLAEIVAGRPWIGDNPLTYVIDADAELAQTLLDEEIITVDQLCQALAGQRGEAFEAIAPLAYERGADPDDLAAAVVITAGWSRSHLADCEEALQYLRRLAEGDNLALREIAQAGIRHQEKRLQQLREADRRRRVRGE
jgi:hypothetical protein